MGRTVVVLDYGGTLDRLGDPVAFVKSLRERGFFTILYTGHGEGHIRGAFPGLIEEFCLRVPKPQGSPQDWLPDPLLRTLFVDDDALAGAMIRDWVELKHYPWEFIPASDIETLRKRDP